MRTKKRERVGPSKNRLSKFVLIVEVLSWYKVVQFINEITEMNNQDVWTCPAILTFQLINIGDQECGPIK